jgi:type VI protein secretion system component VasF
MSGMRNEQRVSEIPTQPEPVDISQRRLVYASRVHRNRQYRLSAALFILAVATGVVVVLLANWLGTSMSR